MIRAAVVDTHGDFFCEVVGEDNSDPGVKGEFAVSSGKLGVIEDFAVGCGEAIKAVSATVKGSVGIDIASGIGISESLSLKFFAFNETVN